MSQEPKSFTVNDRRQFTPDGERREEGGPAPPQTKSAPPEPAAAGGPEAGAAPKGAAELGPFILSLAAQASYLLAGEGGDAKVSESAREEAHYLISILEMLQDKTQGRRTPEEDQILAGVLYELRLGFVARTRAGGA
jgi:hypothetical protein